ncbi:CDP-alcohol phosphatidyltransferase family protein [Coralliovum pocilloporae]|uniref:CDP-alcohol phosphatidyltransferase family protein n=1 Tax=Coralliovum pocilloporae TaxID=3066369 RepID=UPI0033079CD2
MTLPNLISIARLLIVPLIIWLILDQYLMAAFVLFVVAGISDAIDGYLARLMNSRSALGTYLDPIADKTLLVSVYIALGIPGIIPLWLVILIVSRDVLIVGGVLLARLIHRPMVMRPLMISKINTTMQIILAASSLGSAAFGVDFAAAGPILFYLVAATTVFSTLAYAVEWMRHMSDLDEDGAHAP